MFDQRNFQTASGHRGLDLVEPLIFELDGPGRCGVDLPIPPEMPNRIGGLEREAPIGLPGLSEPQVVRHFVRLSRNNYAIDAGLYPLGSCTMKHNPRLNEKIARLPGFADLHPLQPVETVQGALQLIDTLSDWLLKLTGMSAIAVSPAAGAHGELCGLMCIRAALEARGDAREVVLVPESAHGTNPATAAICGYRVEEIPTDQRGRVDFLAMKEKLGPNVAAIMLTNPNTCGLFENDILEISQAVHDAGAFFYCDGANFNAIVGKVRPGDLGIDCMHLNLHKTFSTPHGGGGPGSGPVVLAEALAPFAPMPRIESGPNGNTLIEQVNVSSFGRLKGFHGQMGMFVRALSFILSHGADGLRLASEDAVLNANYILARLGDLFSVPYSGPCMHEVLFDDQFLKDTGVSTLDFAKAMIDEGFHPMTMYFPLVVSGAMLIEPTESESKDSLDQFIASMRHLAERALANDVGYFEHAPYLAPYRRLDEIQAARKPVLRWRPERQDAAE